MWPIPDSKLWNDIAAEYGINLDDAPVDEELNAEKQAKKDAAAAKKGESSVLLSLSLSLRSIANS